MSKYVNSTYSIREKIKLKIGIQLYKYNLGNFISEFKTRNYGKVKYYG